MHPLTEEGLALIEEKVSCPAPSLLVCEQVSGNRALVSVLLRIRELVGSIEMVWSKLLILTKDEEA